jgi:hypothetical protein
MRMTILMVVGLLAATSLFSKTAQGQVVFDNFGPGNVFSRGFYIESGTSSLLGIQSTGMGFTPSASGYLSSIDIALQFAQIVGFTNDAHLFLANGVPSVNGTTTLEAFALIDLPLLGRNGGNTAFDTLTSIAHPLLMAGQTYYLYEVETGGEVNGWHFNSIGAQGPVIGSTDNTNYTTDTATQ